MLLGGTMNFQIQIMNETQQKWLIQDYVLIGTDSTCHIQLTGSQISARHAKLEIKDKKLILKDLKSDQGTFINDAQILEALVQDGDLIRLGQTEFMVIQIKEHTETFKLSSQNEQWQLKLNTLHSAAKTDFPILLLGPSGTGKDVLAQAVHESSYRANEPFVSVNCSALSETLIESELFGHVKGSFTGAISDRKGAFESARGGTLFLDEIGDLPISLQAKLLRALENAEIRPVGSDKNIKTNVRIIAATHQNLKQKIQNGEFRLDLYYRLNVICVETPALINRLEDFEALFYSFAKQMRVRFSFNAISRLKSYSWPGNIRELKNVVARASALFPKEYITETHLASLLNDFSNTITAHQHLGLNSGSHSLATNQRETSVLKELEKQMILKRLAANHGNQKLTAHDIGMPKSTLHDRIKHYKIDVNQFKPKALQPSYSI